MRRLPIFFVIDVSESMAGDPIEQVEEGLRKIITELKKDPYALETAYISIIVFAGKAKTLVPLTDIISFYPPKYSIGAGTGYGNALKHLVSEIEKNVKKSTMQSKGDWKPIIYFLTDGNPTDNYMIDLGVWQQKWKDNSNTIVVSIGDNADHETLRRISDNVLSFDDSDTHSYKEFFKWVTGSIKTQSQKIEQENNDGEIELSGFDKNKLKKITPFDQNKMKSIDDRYAMFFGKCQNNNNDYLLKYRKSIHSLSNDGLPEMYGENYSLQGSYLLDKEYAGLSTEGSLSSVSTISTEMLRGIPNCPSCNNQYAMCICQCGGIFCIDSLGIQTCPHCNQTAEFGNAGGHLDIDRQQG
jgi:uncharacterized protein YegL